MLTIRKATDRGVTNFGWLDSKHTFSFGDYHDPKHTHFRTLRVINDDIIAGGGQFGSHPHRDMEIFTYVLSGSLEHQDSMGNGSVIRAGEWQFMSAGTGVMHSEANPSPTEPVHLLQMWVFPEQRNLKPSYAQKLFTDADKHGRWQTALSRDGRDGSMVIHQDATISVTKLGAGDKLAYDFAAKRGGWLHVATGAVTANGHTLKAGDALAIEDVAKTELTGVELGEVLLFDLA